MIDAELLKILCCPETHQALRVAETGLIERLNREVVAGKIKNRAGTTVSETMNGGLIREDGKYLYPIRKDIPIMLIDEALPL